MCENSTERALQEAYHPWPDRTLRGLWIAACAVALIGGVAAYLGGLDSAAIFVSASILVLVLPVDVFARIFRARRKKILMTGKDNDAVVMNKTTMPIGPTHRLTVEYRIAGNAYRNSSAIPYRTWLRYHAGDKVTIRLIPCEPQYWILANTGEH